MTEALARKSQIANPNSQYYFDSGHGDIKSQMNDQMLNEQIIKKINKCRPDVLLVAYGAPWQEKWLWRNRDVLKVKIAIGVGGAFDYLTGVKKLPPKFVERCGLEWLWRLIREPWRWKRQLALVRFAVMVAMKD